MQSNYTAQANTSTFLSVAQLAKRLHMSPSFIYNAVEAGKLRCHKLGNRFRFSEQQIQDFLSSGENNE